MMMMMMMMMMIMMMMTMSSSRYPHVPVIHDSDEDAYLSVEDDLRASKEQKERKSEPLVGHSNNGAFEGMPYISQPLPDPDGEFDLSSRWGEGGGGWNSNWNFLVEQPELYHGMGITFDQGEG